MRWPERTAIKILRSRKLERRNRAFAAMTFAIRPKFTVYILALCFLVKNPDRSSKKNEPNGAFYPPKLYTYPHILATASVDSMKADYFWICERIKYVKKMKYVKNGGVVSVERRAKFSTFVENIGGQLVTMTKK
jgi:hypothetical protein